MSSYDAASTSKQHSFDVATQTQTVNIVFTDAAAEKVLTLIQEENDPNLNLRAYISGGGCSGFQYGFTFDASINPDDYVIEKYLEAGQVNLLIDSLSYQYLSGATIDFVKDIQGEQFVIQNPNAKTTCGCGSSFSM